jgi:hypothetical protein
MVSSTVKWKIWGFPTALDVAGLVTKAATATTATIANQIERMATPP